MSSNLMVLPPETLLQNQYRIVRVLGKPGGFGITYLAWDTLLETHVAIKEYFPRDYVGRGPDRATVLPYSSDDADAFRYGREQFLQEARTLAKFDHAHVVRVFNFFEANSTAYFVMAYYEGYSLSEYVRQQGGKLSADHAVQLMLPVLDGLREVHSKGFLHRDVKPQNIYLASNGRPILLDFGAARMAMSARSRSLSVVLTPGFAPYEQYTSRGKQGPWTDIYAAAATLYFLITGKPPLDAADRVMDDDLKPLEKAARDVPPRIAEAVMQGLGLLPEARPQTVRAFQDQLLGVPEPEEAPPPEPPREPAPPKQAPTEKTKPEKPPRKPTLRQPQPTKPPKRKGWLWGLLGLLLVGGGAAAFVLLMPLTAYEKHQAAGQEAHERGDFEAAIHEFQQALALRPGEAEIETLLAEATEQYRHARVAAFAVEHEIQLPVAPEATALTPDGSLLAVGGPLSGQVWLYTLPDGQRLTILPRPSETETQSPRAMVFSPDGRSLYIANSDGTIRKETPLSLGSNLRTHWASRSVQHLTDSYTRHPLHALALFPDGSSLAVASGFDQTWGESIIGSLNLFDNRIFFWNTQTREIQPGLIRPEPEAAIRSLAFAEEGRLLIYGTADGNVHFLENPRQTALSHAAPPTPTQLASWRQEVPRPRQEAPAPNAPPATIPTRIQAHRSDASIVLSPNDRWLATFGNSDTLKIWDTTSRRLHRALADAEATITAAAFTTGQGDGEFLFGGDARGRLHLWSRRLGVWLDTYPAHQGRLMQIYVLGSANIVTIGSDNRVKIWGITARSQ